MPKVVVSTIGASLLTKDKIIANEDLNKGELAQETKIKIEQYLKQKQQEFTQANVDIIRKSSAELNGIFAIYEGIITPNDYARDIHILIATDTAVGKACAQFTEDFLRSRGMKNVQIIIPKKLSMISLEDFEEGIKNLLNDLQEILPGYQDLKYPILFNLVASIKSIQGYLAAFGMFYADEIIYVFEGTTLPISIPRLPIKIDEEAISKYKVQLAIMVDGKGNVNLNDLQGLAPTLYESVDNQAFASSWGEIVWRQIRNSIYTKELLKFPRLEYDSTFIKEFRNQETTRKIKIQEDLAMISVKLEESNGNTVALKG